MTSRTWAVALVVVGVLTVAGCGDGGTAGGSDRRGVWANEDGQLALDFADDGVHLVSPYFSVCVGDADTEGDTTTVSFDCRTEPYPDEDDPLDYGDEPGSGVVDAAFAGTWELVEPDASREGALSAAEGEFAAGGTDEPRQLRIVRVTADETSTVTFEAAEGLILTEVEPAEGASPDPVDDTAVDDTTVDDTEVDDTTGEDATVTAGSNKYNGECKKRTYNDTDVVDCQIGTKDYGVDLAQLLADAQAVDESITDQTTVWVAAIGAKGVSANSGYDKSNGSGGSKGTALTVTTLADMAEIGPRLFYAVGKTQNQKWGSMSGFGGSSTSAWLGETDFTPIDQSTVVVIAGGGGGGGQAGLRNGKDGGAGANAAHNGAASDGYEVMEDDVALGYGGRGKDGKVNDIAYPAGGGGEEFDPSCGGSGGTASIGERFPEGRHGKCGWGGDGGDGCQTSTDATQSPGFRNSLPAVFKVQLKGRGGHCKGGGGYAYPSGGGGGGFGGGASGDAEGFTSQVAGMGGGGGGSWARLATAVDANAPTDGDVIRKFNNKSNAHSGKDGHLHVIFDTAPSS